MKLFNTQENSINKSGTGIHRSGTGIKSGGTGIKSGGTGIKSSGAGMRFVLALALVVGTVCPNAFAAAPDVFVSQRANDLLLSLHSDDGIYVGAVPLSAGESGYFRIGLHQVAAPSDGGYSARPLVKGTGSGASGESAGSVGGSLLVKGTGSGSSGDSTCDSISTLVKGTGSGASGESVGSGGGSTEVKATGSGNAGDSIGGCEGRDFDLLAEVVLDTFGSHIVVRDTRGNELAVAFVAAEGATQLHGGNLRRELEFVAAP